MAFFMSIRKFSSILYLRVEVSVSFLRVVFISFGQQVVVGVGLVVFAQLQITIWHIPRHIHLQSVNQL